MMLNKILFYFKKPSKRQLEKAVLRLWGIIDDIDTYSDIAKGDNVLYRKLTERRQATRWDIGITTDGYNLNLKGIKIEPTEIEISKE